MTFTEEYRKRVARSRLQAEWAMVFLVSAVGGMVLATLILLGVCVGLVAAVGDGTAALERDSLLVQNMSVGFIMGGIGLVLYWTGLIVSWRSNRVWDRW